MPYGGNPNLMSIGETHTYTPDEVKEFLKCKNDAVYFCENYIKIVNVDDGLIQFKPYDYQKRLIKTILNNRYSIAKMPRQCGKCLNKDTCITVRNKLTGSVYDITIGEFYKSRLEESNRIQSRRLQQDGEILGSVRMAKRQRKMSTSSREWISNSDYLGDGLQEGSRKNNPVLRRLSDTVNRKFVDSINLTNFQVLSDKGFVSATAIHKTI